MDTLNSTHPKLFIPIPLLSATQTDCLPPTGNSSLAPISENGTTVHEISQAGN